MLPDEMLTPTTRMTWPEICERFPNQELCLVDVDYADRARRVVLTARVVGHGNTNQEAVDQALLVTSHDDMITFRSTRPRMIIQPPRPQLIVDGETLEIFYGGPRIVLDDETREIAFARPQPILHDEK
jgi:hypothetical protein